MQSIKHAYKNFLYVFKSPKYIFLLVIISFLFYSLNNIILNFKNIISVYSQFDFLVSSKLFFLFFFNLQNIIAIPSFVSLIIISILFGILISLLIYRYKNIADKKYSGSFLASIGIFLGLLVPGCAACGIGLLSLIGLSAAFIKVLPFDGLEISIISILVMLTSIFFTSRDLLECKIKRR